MGSLGGSEDVRKKAMWVFPKMMGAYNPSERWGHSACYFNGLIYIFGGCRGGVHFSDVLVCELSTMTWNILKTSGPGPGPRDSHSAVLVGHRMLVFGGTNGSKKVNDLHVLDLRSMEWARPECRGSLPPARESHSCNVIGNEKLVVFGGSGEGEANYLNDLHILDLRNMEWSSPIVRGNVPAPRDSHSSVAVGNKLYVFGGDSGDRYQGDVSVFDVNKLIWSRLDSYGPLPGPRAGHASVYVLGGVGDKQYYNDIWVLDAITSTWVRLDATSQKSQGRFSHTATVTNLGIAVFGGCGEDERPLNELLVLQIDPLTSIFLNKSENNLKMKFVAENEDVTSPEVEEIEFVPRQSVRFSSDMLHPKRRRTSNLNLLQRKPEPEEHSNSPSQQSSPSQSDHDQVPIKKIINGPYSSRVHPMFRQKIYELSNTPVNQTNPKHTLPSPKIFLSSEHPINNKPIKLENKNVIRSDVCRCNAAEESVSQNLIGAEVRGQVDGAFDSGYIMTATVNGKVFRGVLFAPAGPDVVNHANSGRNNSNVAYLRHLDRPVKMPAPCEQTQSRRSSPENRAPLGFGKDSRSNSELQGVVLTLASPGSGLGGL
ncbi:tip elongation aberrant protein 1 [Phtheirospermum japonicum]|uniref:Tip elongation aberrant protein 1 n=1 Tax=Phtheirospermum japonicum TaxID=374723 RepID=A0A830BM82_9LAMI|nr:tip elongation aberrant protein 1 [Phtheirospermum japonicum]